jgi:hypothetical protein
MNGFGERLQQLVHDAANDGRLLDVLKIVPDDQHRLDHRRQHLLREQIADPTPRSLRLEGRRPGMDFVQLPAELCTEPGKPSGHALGKVGQKEAGVGILWCQAVPDV